MYVSSPLHPRCRDMIHTLTARGGEGCKWELVGITNEEWRRDEENIMVCCPNVVGSSLSEVAPVFPSPPRLLNKDYRFKISYSIYICIWASDRGNSYRGEA